jgi:DNA-directed RNA polymerase specialized sigma24 family protein
VAELPDSQRRVVVAKLWEGRSLAEIAQRLGTSEAACKMRFARGLARLRDRLKEEGIEP